MSTNHSVKVLIVGGGIAGLSAARYLADHGVKDFVVLESQKRLGGRVYTEEHRGMPLEMGAQWIVGGCPANSMFNLANR